ncbi:hypothetical protein ACFFX0_32965 [Citricoccus parietis]|uniref:Uncharacterized protein n=1 Tax=Citricoccus parietis TaxID=592307 RepID=A0ABV5G9T8_9MICC
MPRDRGGQRTASRGRGGDPGGERCLRSTGMSSAAATATGTAQMPRARFQSPTAS